MADPHGPGGDAHPRSEAAEAAWIGRVAIAIPLLMDVAPFALWTRIDNDALEWLLVGAPVIFWVAGGALVSISARAADAAAARVLRRYARWTVGLGVASLLLTCFSVLFVCSGGPATLRT